ncbi:MAG: hypothetical protein H6734_14640 [Alphaproteobacteria bacterium]|nr:hypothetical protein [Alphaproteobacteria bacterium]
MLEALHVHWPEEPAFFFDHVRSDKDYARAELQASRFLGVTFEGERPPFFVAGP